MEIIFLHHSTGSIIWRGFKPSLVSRAAKKINPRLAAIVGQKPMLPALFEDYNKISSKSYNITELVFPKTSPYGWHNYPYDYYNIWVKNSGAEPFMEEPTLEILTRNYQVIIFKHCYPVSNIQADKPIPDIDSDYRSVANYKLQYLALREKLHAFRNTRFIIFTGAALVKNAVTEEAAARAGEFFKWVREEWDLPGDNIHLWDLYGLETEGGLYLKYEYASSPTDSHPNGEFAGRVVHLLFNRIIDVIENEGMKTTLTGEKIRNI
jgi:hypothetical protein